MKAKKILLLILLFIPAFSFAGEIYGTIYKNGAPLNNQQITITSADGKEIKSTTTDAKGFFSISMNQMGKCTLSVNDHCSVEVYSTDDSNGYTLNYEDQKTPCLQKK